MAHRYDEKLRSDIKLLIDGERVSMSELSRSAGVPKSSLSSWLNQCYPGDPSNHEAKLRSWLRVRIRRTSLTARDENRLVRIYALIDEADNPSAVVGRIVAEKSDNE
jgi:DNA transposition AAA+ family ATPase